MLHFIPAWYATDSWAENEQKWYVRRTQTEFDDTVKQIQLFHRNHVYDYKIMLLSFAPNFRHFLHRQSVFHAPYWSCFDAIQEIQRKKAATLSFHNLKWPEGVEFIYTPFVIYVEKDGDRIAQMEFGEDGNLIQVDMYENSILCRRNFYDDRGFLSQTIVYTDGKPLYKDYLMENGTRKMREHGDGRVEFHPDYARFMLSDGDKNEYIPLSGRIFPNMEAVVTEVTRAYVESLEEKDMFCVAMHPNHMNLLRSVFQEKKTILSFFQERIALSDLAAMKELLGQAAYLITDSKELADGIQRESKTIYPHIEAITPFDTRVDFGISQQLHVQKILVPVDGLQEPLWEKLIEVLGKYLLQNKRARVHLFTREAQMGREEELLTKVRRLLVKNGWNPSWARKDTVKYAENNLDEIEEVPVRFFVEQCVDELSVSKCMREQRVIVDIRDIPELYLQISSVSMGVPQIVRTATEFVEHRKNGWVVQSIDEIAEALQHYLDGVANWNEAVVNAYEIGKKYTTERLLMQWREVIKQIG